MKKKPVLTLETDKSRKQMRNFFLAIFGFTFLLYGSSIKNEYALDDNYVTVTNAKQPNNPRVEKGISGIPEIFTSHYVESREQSFEYRPLPLTTFAIEYQFFGSNPHISHFINILIYALTCMLLFSILCRVLKGYNIIFPLLVTCLFLAHPIHTEAVSNIKCRDELLAFLFGLYALQFFLKRTVDNKWLPVFYASIFLFLALLCKKTAVLFIVLIPLTVYFFTDIKLRKIVLPGVLLFSAFLIFNLFRRFMLIDLSSIREFAFFENPLFYETDFLKRIPVVFYTIGYYIRLFLFPYPLSCYYGYDAIPITGFGSPFVIISAILHVAGGIYALIKFSEKNILSYGILIYLLGIFPFANIAVPMVGIIGERFIYFASLGFCILAAYFILKLFKIDLKNSNTGIKAIKPSVVGISVIILIIYSVLTISRNNKWKDVFTLFRNDVAHFERSCNLHYLLGTALYPEIFSTPKGIKREAMIKEATFHYKEAARLMIEGVEKYPKDFTTLSNIGTIYVNILNDAVTAQPFFKKSIAIKQDNPIAQYNFAFCYEKRNLPDSAILSYEKLIGAQTTYPLVYIQLNELYLKKQAYPKAIACNELAIKQNPLGVKFYINLGNALVLNKDTINAIKQFKKAVELEPNNTNLRSQIDAFLKATGYIERYKN